MTGLSTAVAVGHLSAEAPSVDVRQTTSGPKHHFFGYIGHVQTIPWNANGRYILALETAFDDRMPKPEDAASIVLINTRTDYSTRIVDQSRAWNPQQGTMFYWNPDEPRTQFFFNDRDPKTGKVFCVLFEIDEAGRGKRIREYRFDRHPVGNSGIAQNGGEFLGINDGNLFANFMTQIFSLHSPRSHSRSPLVRHFVILEKFLISQESHGLTLDDDKINLFESLFALLSRGRTTASSY